MPDCDYLPGIQLAELPALGRRHQEAYANASPYPNIYLDNFFEPRVLHDVLAEFPDLRHKSEIRFDSPDQVKLASRGEYRFGKVTRGFMHFLNSQPFLEFLTELTGIEALLADPYFEGGGCHEILPGGFLKVHADFNKHRRTGIDRRLNVLIYLNEDWREEYGGHFELWSRDMTRCERKVLPIFNRMAIFTTTDDSFHGHPDPLTCPPDRSRRSLALYYYTVGRPANEVRGQGRHTTQFQYRATGDERAQAYGRRFFKKFSPGAFVARRVSPLVTKLAERLSGK
jgi:hypothetical protein